MVYSSQFAEPQGWGAELSLSNKFVNKFVKNLIPALCA